MSDEILGDGFFVSAFYYDLGGVDDVSVWIIVWYGVSSGGCSADGELVEGGVESCSWLSVGCGVVDESEVVITGCESGIGGKLKILSKSGVIYCGY